MHQETIPLRITQTGQTMDVVVFAKRADHITVGIKTGQARIDQP